jgi:methionine synthase II (cobalamin-independent)
MRTSLLALIGVVLFVVGPLLVAMNPDAGLGFWGFALAGIGLALMLAAFARIGRRA